MKISKLIHVECGDLIIHPKNIRKHYPHSDVTEMSASILATDGVLEPLIVVPDPTPGSKKYLVVDGNMRLMGARLLGNKCPPLECKVVHQGEAEQFLSMAVANQVRYEIDPVSEGIHYKMMENEGLTVRAISKKTGIYEARISNRRVLADLDRPIQKLIIEKRFPSSSDAARALLKLPSDVRIKLAERLAQNPNLKISTVIFACEKMLQAVTVPLERPAVQISGALNGETHKTTADDLRNAARKTCEKCNQYTARLRENPEPAWSMVVHAADETCNQCNLKDIAGVCSSCPSVELLKNLLTKAANGG